MKISVFGLGYVGCVSAACLADHGHDVVGVDVDAAKAALVNGGRSPITEPGLEELIRRGATSGRLRARDRVDRLGDVAMVCVGTPGNKDGSLGLAQMLGAVRGIGELLRAPSGYPIVTIRSTVLPGTVERTIVPLLEETSGKLCGADFGVCMNPEFMRESTAIRDFRDPPFTVIGAREDRAAERLQEVYAKLTAPVARTSLIEAEMIKYACNAFHAAKICFANEIATVSGRLGVDGHRVMDILCRDDKLNLSRRYLEPGFAFGGPCLPKDLRALLHQARALGLELPMLGSLLESNRKQIDGALQSVRATGKRRIGVLGLSFKAGTDDLRESPAVAFIAALIHEGYRVRVYDDEVVLASLYGANRRHIERAIPGIGSLVTASPRELIDASEVIVVAKKRRRFAEMLRELPADRIVIDRVRLR